MSQRITSWSGACATRTLLVPSRGFDCASAQPAFIPRGGGNSFGDAAFLTDGFTVSCLDEAGLDMEDDSGGAVTCGAGVTMGHLHAELERRDLHLGVYGGTQFATAGGAVASDIHGKNDRAVGSCGNHVLALRLRTATGEVLHLSRSSDPELFSATLGGLGLTGVIDRVTFRVSRRERSCIRVRGRRVRSMPEMLACFAEVPSDHHVGDWLLPADAPDAGFFWYAVEQPGAAPPPPSASNLWLPRTRALGRFTVGLNSRLMALVAGRVDMIKHPRAFHYGGVHQRLRNWNRLYGRRGFCEYHWAVAADRFLEVYEQLVALARQHAVSPLFGVVKAFGSIAREGLLSFPGEGFAFSFQMENTPRHRAFMLCFTERLVDAGGRAYLTKDSVLAPRHVERMYPALDRWRAIVGRVDPEGRVRSDLSTRLGLKP